MAFSGQQCLGLVAVPMVCSVLGHFGGNHVGQDFPAACRKIWFSGFPSPEQGSGLRGSINPQEHGLVWVVQLLAVSQSRAAFIETALASGPLSRKVKDGPDSFLAQTKTEQMS